ncbi:MAG: type II-A CRISPR-associated protein Csn2 [Culicoidibacterales bacterium]
MIVRIAAMEEELEILTQEVGVIEFATPQFFAKIIRQLHQMQVNEPIEQQQIILLENQKIVTLENQLLLFDLCSIPESLKKLIMKKLVLKIEKELAIDVELRECWQEIQRKLFVQTMDFVNQYQIDYDFSEMVKIQDLLKAVQFELVFDQSYQPIELLQLIVRLNMQFNLYDRIVIVDCKKYMTDAEIVQFYERVIIAKQTVLLVESQHDSRRFSFERKLQIADDFTCKIIRNMV